MKRSINSAQSVSPPRSDDERSSTPPTHLHHPEKRPSYGLLGSATSSRGLRPIPHHPPSRSPQQRRHFHPPTPPPQPARSRRAVVVRTPSPHEIFQPAFPRPMHPSIIFRDEGQLGEGQMDQLGQFEGGTSTPPRPRPLYSRSVSCPAAAQPDDFILADANVVEAQRRLQSDPSLPVVGGEGGYEPMMEEPTMEIVSSSTPSPTHDEQQQVPPPGSAAACSGAAPAAASMSMEENTAGDAAPTVAAEPSPSSSAAASPTTEDDGPSAPLSGGRRPGGGSSSSASASASTSSGAADDRTSRDYYFDSYSHHGIHEEMLKDEVRTRTYQLAMLNNRHLFEGKIVLDVGCGTGVLSMFAAQAGAAHVYGIDCSTIIEQAKEIVSRNGFSDRITLIKGKVEEVELDLPGDSKVDIIISEWMGYFLLYESMLDTVLFARDKWLKPGGIMFPDKAVMYLCGIEDAQVKHDRIDFWDNVYGFDMTPLKEIALMEPVVDVVDAKAVLTDSVPILNIDILTCTKEDLSFSSPFTLRANRNDYVHGFVAYFECAFTQVHKPIGFSTAPFAKYTHWKQTIFYTRQTLTICEEEEITGQISCRPNPKNNRDLDITLDVNFDGRHSKMNSSMEYRLR